MAAEEVALRAKLEGARKFASDARNMARSIDDIGDSATEAGDDMEDAGQKGERGFGLASKAAGILTGVLAGISVGAVTEQFLAMDDASKRLSASLALTGSEASRVKGITDGLFQEGWGADPSEVTAVLSAIDTAYGDIEDISDRHLRGWARRALGISRATGEEGARITQAAGQLVRSGMARNMTEAMDLIASGFSGGADAGQEFVDTLTEYMPVVAKLGLSGEQFISMLSQAAPTMKMGADKTGDALKEMGIRLTELDERTKGALSGLGLDPQQVRKNFLEGGEVAAGQLDYILGRLNSMGEGAKRDNAMYAIFGAPAEDLGAGNLLSILQAGADGMEGFEGASGRMSDEVRSASMRIEAFKRRLIGFGTDVLGNQVIPFVTEFKTELLLGAGLITTYVVATKTATVVSALFAASTGNLTVAQRLLNLALGANPIVRVVMVTALLVAGFVALYQRSETFRGAVQWLWSAMQAAWGWVKANWPLLVSIIGGPIGAAVVLVIRNFDKIKAGAARVKDWFSGVWSGVTEFLAGPSRKAEEVINAVFGRIEGIWRRVQGMLPGNGPSGAEVMEGINRVTAPNPYARPRARAGGGGSWHGNLISQAGARLVGERGPEVLSLPRGARVDPIPPAVTRPLPRESHAPTAPRVIQLVVSGRVLAEVVDDEVAAAGARA